MCCLSKSKRCFWTRLASMEWCRGTFSSTFKMKSTNCNDVAGLEMAVNATSFILLLIRRIYVGSQKKKKIKDKKRSVLTSSLHLIFFLIILCSPFCHPRWKHRKHCSLSNFNFKYKILHLYLVSLVGPRSMHWTFLVWIFNMMGDEPHLTSLLNPLLSYKVKTR